MQESRAVWLPYRSGEFSGPLPDGLSYHFWDGLSAFPSDPRDVRFVVVPPVPAKQHEILDRLLHRTERLEVLQVLSSGHDYLAPFMALLPSGTRVATANGVHGDATAELAVTLLLAAERGLDDFFRRHALGQWQPRVFPTLSGKEVLVVGQGAVGKAVAVRLAAFGCRVVRLARTARDTADGHVHGFADLPRLLPSADAVVLCAPLTDETRDLMDASRLALMQDGAVLVNVARGELVDTRALVREAGLGRLRAALDVTAPEPLPSGHPLWYLPGVLITPHVGAFTDAFTPASLAFIAQQLTRYARDESLANVLPVMAAAN
ncbi:NAD(P)-dependent oxidoreductase [Actinacidiphila sp. bgisy160]|uniref:NAD(P)-dependent oxidoreductase n=1 Tax=Actinacidiphila sp. bgisy160 TaxID=3413796 RepID=UPI003D74B5A2